MPPGTQWNKFERFEQTYQRNRFENMERRNSAENYPGKISYVEKQHQGRRKIVWKRTSHKPSANE